MEFNEGDIVLCIDDETNYEIRKGKTYTILKVEGNFLKLNGIEYEASYLKGRFKLVKNLTRLEMALYGV